MQALQVIELAAGDDALGRPLIEKLQVTIDDKNQATLVRSPAFVKGLARGDVIRFDAEQRQFSIVKRAGNLCIRVISKGDISALEAAISSELEKLGGQLDTETERMLVYSIHVSCGFNAIESILDRYTKSADSIWFYGNVYDPQDGQTPLNWWLDILKPE